MVHTSCASQRYFRWLCWQLKADRDSASAEAALDALRVSAASTESTSDGNHPMNLVKLSIDAARAR